MAWSDYWGALSSRQRMGLGVGALLIVAATAGLAVWLLRDPYVPLAAGLSSERLNELTRELGRAKLEYRIDAAGEIVSVPQSQLGEARAAVAGGPFEAPPSVGLELFKETDFSSTDFAQRINYQRALQGELTRTIQTIEGVRNARVHVILAEGGLFKRDAAKATAAVSLSLQPGKSLARSQVRGIQRLVAAAVPQIKVDDVVVLDESGTSLTRAAEEAGGDLSSAQLDLKRQADQYLESKLSRLLQELVPHGVASISVDTTLDAKQVQVTTDEPIAAQGSKDAVRATGVMVKERQSQRGRAPGMLLTGGSDSTDADSTDWEYEYKVGHRTEQALSAPGSIKRVSVAVALQGAPAELSSDAVAQLVEHAVGIDHERGDSVAVFLLPASQTLPVEASAAQPAVQPPSRPVIRSEAQQAAYPRLDLFRNSPVALAMAVAALAIVMLLWILLRTRPAAGQALQGAEVDIDATAAKVRQWLNEGAKDGRA